MLGSIMGFHSYGKRVCCIGQTASTVVCADLLRDVQGMPFQKPEMGGGIPDPSSL